MPHVTGDRIESPAEPVGIVRVSVDIAASAAEVFRALADPRELAAWLGSEPMPTDPRDTSSAEPSRLLPEGEWRIAAIAPDGTLGVIAGEYGHRSPPLLLDMTWRASWNDFATERVRFQLAPIDVGGVSGTRVTVTHTRAAGRLHATTATLTHAGMAGDPWPSWLARLTAHVATASALARWSGRDVSPNDSFDALHRAVVDLHHAR